MSFMSKIDILTRVEGHGSVKLIRDGGKVVDARLDLYESPRLFEALLVGRRFDEIPDIACRICSICSTVHKVAALQAVEHALAINVSRQTGLLRELAVQGGQIESHALHIFCLALPDYRGAAGIQELLSHEPEMLRSGLRIKKLGNLIQETVGGRAIHPFNLLIGGLGKVPDTVQLQSLKDKLSAVHDDLAASVAYILSLDDILPPLAMPRVCAVSGGPPLFGDHLITATDVVPARSAAAWLDEEVQLHTHAKVSRFRETAPFMVGPLARLALAMPPVYTHYFTKASLSVSIKARVIELEQAVERAQVLIDQLLDAGVTNEFPVDTIPAKGEGVSILEAPRGVLLHSYRLDGDGVCVAANIITPTAINQGSMALSLKELVSAMDGAEYEQIKRAAEILIRCYDPCISCAVH